MNTPPHPSPLAPPPTPDPSDVVRLLPDSVINQIAAGEVVERPASVLKELMDNSIDAGATHIEVDVVDGGRRLVRVRDDGKGMDRDNALMSLERHATSKLRDIKDLDTLATMGFRGEALAAISSVSQFTMVTNRAGSPVGTEIVSFGGRVQEVRDAGAPPGTDIAVRNLFFNVPARRRFLRSAQTEYTHIRQQFFLEAISRPDIAFVLRADDEEASRLPPAADIRERVRDFYGEDAAAALRSVSYADGIIEVGGWAGVPPYSRTDREMQVFLINGRAVGSSVLNYAVQAAYRDVMPAGRYAPLFITITLPQNLVDVNVHPAKKDIRFRRPVEVRDVLIEALRLAIKGNSLAPRKPAFASSSAPSPAPAPAAPRPSAQPQPPSSPSPSFALAPEAPRFAPEQSTLPLPLRTPLGAASGPANLSRSATPGPDTATASSQPDATPAPASPWRNYRLLGRIANTYAVLETDDGMVLLDPRSAHERILFEKWMRAIRDHKVPSQGLLSPAAVRLSPHQANAIRRHLDWFTANGFGLADLGSDTFLADALPAWLADAAPSALLSDMADVLLQGGRAADTDWITPFLADLVSRRATGLRDRLDDAALNALIRALGETEMPYTSPRGRPTAILLSLRELNRKFRRED